MRKSRPPRARTKYTVFDDHAAPGFQFFRPLFRTAPSSTAAASHLHLVKCDSEIPRRLSFMGHLARRRCWHHRVVVSVVASGSYILCVRAEKSGVGEEGRRDEKPQFVFGRLRSREERHRIVGARERERETARCHARHEEPRKEGR